MSDDKFMLSHLEKFFFQPHHSLLFRKKNSHLITQIYFSSVLYNVRRERRFIIKHTID